MLKELRWMDLKAKNYLFQVVDKAILETILHKETAKQIWDLLKRKYQSNARAMRQQLQSLRAEFETLRVKNDEIVAEYFAKTMAIANKLRIHGEQMEDIKIIEKVLRSKTAKFSSIVTAIEESHILDAMTLDEMQNSLQIHERKS